MIPRPKTAILVRAPPEERDRNPTTPAWLEVASSDCTWLQLMPGQGMFEPKRYTAMMKTVKRTLLRRSGTRNMFARFVKVLRIGSSLSGCCRSRSHRGNAQGYPARTGPGRSNALSRGPLAARHLLVRALPLAGGRP